ncbi:hypothetical protein ES703_81221 [subsurface metagenome]
MKLGKIEKKIIQALERPYPAHYLPDIYCYPIHGSDMKHLVREVFGTEALDRGQYLVGSAEASLSRALVRLQRKDIVVRVSAKAMLRDPFMLRERFKDPCPELPHSTKFWWILTKDLNEYQRNYCRAIENHQFHLRLSRGL